MAKMNIVLMGYRCSGKSSVGMTVANMLRVPFYDTDEMIRQRTGRTVAEIVRAGGWPAFRDAEKEVVRGLAGVAGSVIAVGGGTPLDPENAVILKKNGFFVWLSVDPEILVRRLKGGRGGEDQRPPLSNGEAGGEMERILKERIPVYRSLTDLTIETGEQTVEEIAERIRAHVENNMR
jgi:shikimate kinase